MLTKENFNESHLRWKISVIPGKLTREKMFDLDLYAMKTDEQKKCCCG